MSQVTAMKQWGKTAFKKLDERSQRALKVLGVALVVTVAYAGIYQPSAAFAEQQQTRAEHAAALQGWVQANESDIHRLGAGVSQDAAERRQRPDGERELMTVVTGSAQAHGVTLQRFEPAGGSQVRVWVEQGDYGKVAGWLEALDRDYAVSVSQAAMDRAGEAGKVSARVTLAL
ncbi:MAG: general secretion pathway protein M [Marinobacter sp. T13-3]|nr:MAG: general secretion pathway protein M [Marinobacter sp. T13-3]